MICGESNCYNQSYPTSPTALSGPPDANELCPSPELYSEIYNATLSLNVAIREDLQWWLALTTTPVGAPVCSPDPSITVHSDASNQGWGAMLNGQSQTGDVVSRGNKYPHKLSGTTALAAFLAIKAFGKSWQNISLTVNGQLNCSELHKPERGHSVQSSVQISGSDLDLVHGEKHHSPSGAHF